MNHIRFSKKQIEKKSDADEKRLLLYCIDALSDIIEEGIAEKIFDFADIIHNIPDIFLGERSIDSFRKEIKAFREKYGTSYFPDIHHKIFPSFPRKAPANAIRFFHPGSDEDFRKLHPRGYWALVVCGLTALMLPVIVFLVYVLAINPAPNRWTILIGWIGAFIFGVGLFNIVAAWIHQYLGHKVTVACLLIGAALIALGLFLLYHEI